MLTGDDLATIVSQKGVDAILSVGPLRGRSIEIATAALASRSRAAVLIRLMPPRASRREAQSIKKPTYQRVSFAGLLPNPRRMLRPFR